MLSVTPSFSGGVLSFTGDTVSAVDTITLAVNSSDNVTLNGNEFLGGFAAAAVTEIFIETGGGNDVVNLTGVLREKFVSLTDGAIEVYGEAGNDTIYGSPFGDIIYGGDGGDTIEGGDGNDQLFGGAGVDWLKGGNGDDLLEGGVDTNSDILQGEAGNDVLKGQGGSDTIQGNDGDDVFWVGVGSATFWGGAGADTYIFDPATGDLNTDTIRDDSGAGIDTLDFSLFSGGAVANVTASLVGNGTVQTTASNKVKFKINSGSAIENATGGEGDDTLTGNALNNTIIGGDGDDTLSGGDGNDFLSGDGGNDSLTGGDGDDVYWFDPILGALGSDTIYEAANADSDTLDFSGFSDDVSVDLADTGAQTVVSSVLTLTIANYNTAIENIIGGAGGDALYGNSRANMIDGRDGNDSIFGYDGDDRLYGGAGIDLITGDNGSDAIFGGDGDDVLYGEAGDDFIYGEGGNDYLHGSAGNDYIDGGDGDDYITSGAGNDTLIGGAGDDELIGGTDQDTYVYRWVIGDDGLGEDTITENTSGGSDTVDFTKFYADDYAAPNPATSGAQTVSEIQASDPIVVGESQVIRDLLTITFANTSQVESIDDPDTFASAVLGVFATPSSVPNNLQLVAVGVRGDLDKVTFYWDSNSNGIWDESDTWLGEDTDGEDGWTIELEYDAEEGGYLVDNGVTTETVIFGPFQNTLSAVTSLNGIAGAVAMNDIRIPLPDDRPPLPRGSAELVRDLFDANVSVLTDADPLSRVEIVGDIFDEDPNNDIIIHEDGRHTAGPNTDNDRTFAFHGQVDASSTYFNRATTFANAVATGFVSDGASSDLYFGGVTVGKSVANIAQDTPGARAKAYSDRAVNGPIVFGGHVWEIIPTDNSAVGVAVITGQIQLSWEQFADTDDPQGGDEEITSSGFHLGITLQSSDGQFIQIEADITDTPNDGRDHAEIKVNRNNAPQQTFIVSPNSGVKSIPFEFDVLTSIDTPATITASHGIFDRSLAKVDTGGDELASRFATANGFNFYLVNANVKRYIPQ